MSHRRSATAAVLGLTVAGVVAASSLPATADPAPSASDVVGVGSDIIQNTGNFLADGNALGSTGYNAAGNKYRLISFDATADANGRNAYTDPALGASTKLNPSVVLRAGSRPVQRPNGGGAGVDAITNDTAGLIDFVRSPNEPKGAQQNKAIAASGVGPLVTLQIATDSQVIATAATTNAPPTLTKADIVNIYSGAAKRWKDIPNYSGPAPDAFIEPLRPQDGAGVLTVFQNQLKTDNGGTAVTFASAVTDSSSPDFGYKGVQAVQQNDPTTLSNANRLVPFPVGRNDLIGQGYFQDPNQPYPSTGGTPPTNSAITLHKAADEFNATIPYYIIVRQSDLDSATPWQPGSTLNWVQTLFYNPDYDPEDPASTVPPPFVWSPQGRQILQQAGLQLLPNTTDAYVAADHGQHTTG